MKENPNTRNIFTKQGRLNRLVDKHNKTVQLINKMNKILDSLDKKWNSMEIPLNEINEEVYGSDDETNVCIICCDECGHEFNILDDNIKKTEDNVYDNGHIYVEPKFTCPKCGFENEIDLDDDECEDCLTNESTDEEDSIGEEAESRDNTLETKTCEDNCSNKEQLVKKKRKEVCLKNKSNRFHKVVINKADKSIKFIHDEKIINAIKIAMSHNNRTETLMMLLDNSINLNVSTEDNVKTYSTDNGNISFICNKENIESIEAFTINTKLVLIPHGDQINLYNSILEQLNIEKINNIFEPIDLGGKACLIKLNNGEVAACNFNVIDRDLIMTIIYNIDED